MMERYYDKYVAPGYVEKGFAAPDKKNWVSQIDKHDFNLHPEDYYAPHSEEFLRRMAYSTLKSGSRMINIAGQWVSQAAYMNSVGAGGIFNGGAASTLVSTAAKKLSDISEDYTQSGTFWLNSHPTKAWQMQMASFVGENLAQLPLYEAVKGVRLGLGVGAVAMAPVGAANLTKILAASKFGMGVANTLGESSDAFMGSMISGDGNKNAALNAATWGVLGGSARAGSPLIKWAGTGLIKKFSSIIATQGGHVLQSELSAEAQHIFDIQAKLATGTSFDKLEPHEQELMSQHHDPNHVNADPLKSHLVNAEMHVFESMSQTTYGKPFKDLSKAEQKSLRAERDLLHQKGIAEVSIHAPAETKKLITESLQNDIQQFPQLGKRAQELQEKFGIKVTDALHSAEVEKVAKETGIQNSQTTTAKLGKVKVGAKAPTAKLSAKAAKANDESHRAYYQYKVDSLVYMKNKISSIGGSNKELSAFFKDMELSDFLGEINDFAPNSIKFESPFHQLLWAHQFTGELPQPVGKKIIRELKELNPSGNVSQWSEQARNLQTHLGELAFTGHLFNEGNVFRTTKVDSLLSKTKWQNQLRKEAEAQELKSMELALGKYPEAAKATAKVMKILQRERARMNLASDYAEHSNKIRDLKNHVLESQLK